MDSGRSSTDCKGYVTHTGLETDQPNQLARNCVVELRIASILTSFHPSGNGSTDPPQFCCCYFDRQMATAFSAQVNLKQKKNDDWSRRLKTICILKKYNKGVFFLLRLWLQGHSQKERGTQYIQLKVERKKRPQLQSLLRTGKKGKDNVQRRCLLGVYLPPKETIKKKKKKKMFLLPSFPPIFCLVCVCVQLRLLHVQTVTEIRPFATEYRSSLLLLVPCVLLL